MNFSNRFFMDAVNTWSAIGDEVLALEDEEFDDSDLNEVAWETVLDANRLETFGSKESEAELKAAVKEHGWNKVITHCMNAYPLF